MMVTVGCCDGDVLSFYVGIDSFYLPVPNQHQNEFPKFGDEA